MLINPYVFGDPFFSSVALLLHGDGANDSTSIIDSSSFARTATITGNTKISTAQSKFNNGSILFDGSGDRLTYNSSSAFDFSVLPTTVECFLFLNALPPGGNWCRLLMAGANDVTTSFIPLQISSTGSLNAGVPRIGTTSITHDSVITTGVWYHYALVINGQSSAMFLNGVRKTGNITTPGSANNVFTIGYDTVSTVNANFNGHIEELRITKGVARYSSTSNFTPPVEPYPNK